MSNLELAKSETQFTIVILDTQGTPLIFMPYLLVLLNKMGDSNLSDQWRQQPRKITIDLLQFLQASCLIFQLLWAWNKNFIFNFIIMYFSFMMVVIRVL